MDTPTILVTGATGNVGRHLDAGPARHRRRDLDRLRPSRAPGPPSAARCRPAPPAAVLAGSQVLTHLDAPIVAVTGLGIGATFVTAFTTSLSDAGPAEGGLRSALVNRFHELGGAAGVAVLSSVAGAGRREGSRSCQAGKRLAPAWQPGEVSRVPGWAGCSG